MTLVGPKGLERVVNALRVIAPELPFEIKFIEITQPEQVIELNGYRITAFKVNHNVPRSGEALKEMTDAIHGHLTLEKLLYPDGFDAKEGV